MDVVELKSAIFSDKYIETRKISEECEVLVGLNPDVKNISEGVTSYTYSGRLLAKMGAGAGSVHACRVKLPWGGMALMLERLSPQHAAQDSLTLTVNSKNRLVCYAKADGVSIISSGLKNDSGLLAEVSTRGVSSVIPKQHGRGLEEWRENWQEEAVNVMKKLGYNLMEQGLNGASTVEYGLITTSKDKNGGRVFHIDGVRIGSTKARSKKDINVAIQGDVGNMEIGEWVNNKWVSKEGWSPDYNRSFINTDISRSAVSPKRGSLSFTGDSARRFVSYTDGNKGGGEIFTKMMDNIQGKIVKGRLSAVMMDSSLVSKIDDVTVLLIHFPGKNM